MKTGTWAAGLCLLLLSCAVWILSASFPPSDIANTPGPAFFPRLVVLILVGLTGLMFLENVRKNENSRLFDWASPGMVRNLLLFVLSAVYCGLLGYIGFLILTPICLLVMMLIMQRKGMLGWMMFSSLAATAAIYLVFQVLLDVPLPTWSF
jgi:putative tricarboxylic transport membrane protein